MCGCTPAEHLSVAASPRTQAGPLGSTALKVLLVAADGSGCMGGAGRARTMRVTFLCCSPAVSESADAAVNVHDVRRSRP